MKTINEIYKEIKQLRDSLEEYIKTNDTSAAKVVLISNLNIYNDILNQLEESGVLEEDKEIKELKGKPIIETDRQTGTMKIDNIEFNVEQTKAISHLLEAFEKKVIEDVCNKIKDFTKENWDYDDFIYFLNKLEKGEE